MTNEVWKGINEFKGFYEVSSNGRVRSIDRLVIRSNGRPMNIKGKEIRIGKDKDGYSIVQLYIKGRAYIRKVHRLVYEAFNGELAKDLVVDHIDNDKTNNAKENLQQITGRLNVSKDRKRNLPTGVYKNMHGNGYKVQFQADNTSVYVGTFGSIKEASDIYKKSLSNYKKTGHLPTPVVQRNTINDGKKVCPMCGVEKSLDSFYWANKKKGLRHSRCKECLSAPNNYKKMNLNKKKHEKN
jgi:hypothetical protein